MHDTEIKYGNIITARGEELGRQPTLTQLQSTRHVTCQLMRRSDTPAWHITSVKLKWNYRHTLFSRLLQVNKLVIRENVLFRGFYLQLPAWHVTSVKRKWNYRHTPPSNQISDTRERPFLVLYLQLPALPAVLTW